MSDMVYAPCGHGPEDECDVFGCEGDRPLGTVADIERALALLAEWDEGAEWITVPIGVHAVLEAKAEAYDGAKRLRASTGGWVTVYLDTNQWYRLVPEIGDSE